MTHPHLNAAHRVTVLRKLQGLSPSPATNQTPRPVVRPADPVRALRAAGAKLDRTLVEARKLIGSLKTSPTPAATLRKVETIARSAAADLSAARRFAPARPTAPPRPPLKASGDMSRSARREAAKAASTFSAATAHTFSDALLSQAATHRSSPASDKAIATAELEKRGFTVSPSGTISKSSRK
jgi:hypothetical protein